MIRGLSQYRLLRRLGEGGQGDVYLAFDTRLKRRVCIKLYHLSGSLASRRRAVNEARHLMRVESPQTVDIHDVVSAGARLALVVQYVPGSTLKALLAHAGSLSAANALAVLTDLAAALAALRRAGVVHGDIKPANVLVNTQGRAVLADFGAAQLVGEQWLAYSRESLSPEQSRGEPAALQSDFFALGLLLYGMLFGAHPFCDRGDLDVRRLRGGLREPPVIPGLAEPAAAAIQALLLSLLASRPEARPKGTFELREQLRDVRSLLPAATPLELPVDTTSPSLSGDLAPAGLPRKLVRIPLWQQARAWLVDYWYRGSPGARVLLAAAALLPGVLLTLVWAMPGPCVAVLVPQINVLPGARMIAADEGELRVMLTGLLKEQAENALVLGAGPASDSRYTFGTAGSHNICVANRELYLQVDCAGGQCLLQLQGLRDTQSQELQLFLPQSAGVHDLRQALTQLVRAQEDFLLD